SKKRGKDIPKGLRDIYKLKDKQMKQEIVDDHQTPQENVFYCPYCFSDSPSDPLTVYETLEQMLDHHADMHPQDYVMLKEKILEEQKIQKLVDSFSSMTLEESKNQMLADLRIIAKE
ncbi:hypothetical protein MKW94_005972, partial [Papaver nudicaule]|nr:hypothetical protein [Papaver nudicaule]